MTLCRSWVPLTVFFKDTGMGEQTPVVLKISGCSPASASSSLSRPISATRVPLQARMFNWEGTVVTSHFMSLCVLPLAGETRPFHFITPKHIFLRAYFLEPLSNSPSGANTSLDDGGNRSRGTQAKPSFFLPILVDATEAADSITVCLSHGLFEPL